MPLKSSARNDFRRRSVTRSIVDLNVIAVTASFDGGEKRKPGRILNVYVVPPAVGEGTDAATSGTMRAPSGAGLSGYVTRFAHVAYETNRGSSTAGSSDVKSFSVLM